MRLRDLFSIFWTHQVNGALACNALHRAILGQNNHLTPGDHALVMAPGVKIDKALIIDVGDDQAQLINMPGKKNTGIPSDSGSPNDSHGIALIQIGDRLNHPVHHGLRPIFSACGGASIQ